MRRQRRGSLIRLAALGVVSEAMYRSTIITGTGDDRIERRDTYSVFASLGADFNSSASTNNGAMAGGGLAQFFATGTAAVNISENKALMTALKIDTPQGALAQATAITAAALSDDPAALRTFGQSLPNAGSAEENRQAGQAQAATTRGQVAIIESCARSGGGWRWNALASSVEGAAAPAALGLKDHTSQQWPQIESALLANTSLRAAVLAAGVKTFQCPGG
ncbi:MAG: hypothetical protein EON85_08910 [Brevundimonas sp.]|nr:MAG: hypothetical protein EON85_08910 [Brevundimonas sp.]